MFITDGYLKDKETCHAVFKHFKTAYLYAVWDYQNMHDHLYSVHCIK